MIDKNGTELQIGDKVRFTGPPDMTAELARTAASQYKMPLHLIGSEATVGLHPSADPAYIGEATGRPLSKGYVWLTFEDRKIGLPSSHIEKIERG